MQQRAPRWNRTRGCCDKDGASVYGTPALPTESPGAPHYFIITLLMIITNVTEFSCIII